MAPYVILYLSSVFIAAISQVLLKKEAMKPHKSVIQEYLNPLVVIAYTFFLGTTILSMLAYKGIPLNLGPILETTSYLYITVFGVTIFKEKLTKQKTFALLMIITGIAVYTVGDMIPGLNMVLI
ncbi:MAG: multidrug ABC transporter [bacterium]|nr:multidrug ABC transporter [bacterium]